MNDLLKNLPALERREAVKILVSGPFAAGKTQFISTASDEAPLRTEVEIPHEGAAEKSSTTVALDFGKLKTNSGQEVLLFGTPGQERFEFMWEILAHGMQGLLFLVDATNRADLSNSRSMLNYFRRNYQVPILVCANKQDLPGAQPLAALNAALQLPETIPLLPLCSLQKGSVSRVIKEILQRINQD